MVRISVISLQPIGDPTFTSMNGNVNVSENETKIQINMIGYSGTNNFNFSEVFQGNLKIVPKSDTGTYFVMEIQKSNTIDLRNHEGSFDDSTVQVLQVIEAVCDNNEKIEVKNLYRSNGTIAIIIINIYPQFYVLSN
jgi:hypothetical protein